MKKVFVNGFGSIGSRIASFIRDDPQISVIGVGKHTPGGGVGAAVSEGYDVYVPEKRLGEFDGCRIAGTIESAVDQSDLVIDASPAGQGYKNKTELYVPRKKAAIYQGGETVYGDCAVSDLLFNSRANYDEAIGRTHVMQGSCNVTGMGRILQPLRERFGDRLERFDVTLVRRWADIGQSGELKDTVEMTPTRTTATM